MTRCLNMRLRAMQEQEALLKEMIDSGVSAILVKVASAGAPRTASCGRHRSCSALSGRCAGLSSRDLGKPIAQQFTKLCALVGPVRFASV